MALTKRHAYTLVEMLVYMGCMVVVGALLASIYRTIWRTERANEATFEVTGQAHTVLHTMRAELEETALASVRVDKNTSTLSFCSPRDSQAKLCTSEYGTPRWMKSVVYRLQNSQLLRWELPLSPQANATRNPAALERLPALPLTSARVTLRDLTPRGFRVQFVQRQDGDGLDQLVDTNPVFNQDKPSWNTGLIEVEFSLVNGPSGRQNAYSICWRVSPRS